MSLNPERIKKTILKGIKINPTNIEIKETIKVEKDGALEEIEQINILTVLIYNEKSNDIKISSDKIGTSYIDKNYAMIADYTANLQVNPNTVLCFKCKEGKMKISNVNPIVIKEVICGYECSLERID
ncbi:MAG: hypothetical protein ACRCXT_20925 [Paraclostridium sp.]